MPASAMHPIPIGVLLVVTGLASYTVRRALAETAIPASPPVDVQSTGAAADHAVVAASAAPSIPTGTAAPGSTDESHQAGAITTTAPATATGDPKRTGARASRGRLTASAADDAAGDEPLVANVLAREALRLVGVDPDALVIWRRAINDPRLPAGDRSDLIEDLNDEGYDEQDAFTQADLDLILARLRLIEQEMPFAMDDTNAWAFTEAYQDLLGMLVKARADVAAAAKAKR